MPPADPVSLAAAQSLARSSGVSPLQIRFAGAGRTLVWDGQDSNLLDFAERQGLDIPACCRTGRCGSWATRLVSGTVLYPTVPGVQIAPGFCLMCVGVPQTALVLQ